MTLRAMALYCSVLASSSSYSAFVRARAARSSSTGVVAAKTTVAFVPARIHPTIARRFASYASGGTWNGPPG
jgi:hypothetical protein